MAYAVRQLPEQQGDNSGPHADNLLEGRVSDEIAVAWACAGCNSHKYDKTHAHDPRTGRVVPLFNPRRHRCSRHFAWSADFLFLRGRTASGRATIVALHLSRAELVHLRRALRAIGIHPPSPQ
jgi:hypothetical protein